MRLLRYLIYLTHRYDVLRISRIIHFQLCNIKISKLRVPWFSQEVIWKCRKFDIPYGHDSRALFHLQTLHARRCVNQLLENIHSEILL